MNEARPNTMRILPVEPNDISSLLQISTAAVTHSVSASNKQKSGIISEIHHNIKFWCGSSNCVFVKYQQSNTNIGFMLIKDYWNFSDLFILPEQQGQSVGTSLVKYGIKICQQKSEKDSLRVNSSLNAVDFYKQLGFVPLKVDHPIPDYVLPLEYRFN